MISKIYSILIYDISTLVSVGQPGINIGNKITVPFCPTISNYYKSDFYPNNIRREVLHLFYKHVEKELVLLAETRH